MRVGQTFAIGSPVHWVTLGVILACTVAVCRRGLVARRRGPECLRQFESWFVAALLAIWVAVQIRYLLPDRRRWDWSLPLQVCNVVALFAPFAVRTQARYFRAVLYHVGMGICPIALIAPVLHSGFVRPDYWIFWSYHGGIVAAAAYDRVVRHYRPGLRDFLYAMSMLAIFTPLTLLVDVKLNANYAFLGNVPHPPALLRAFGPWPLRDVWLFCAALASVALLCGLGQLQVRAMGRRLFERFSAPRDQQVAPIEMQATAAVLRQAA